MLEERTRKYGESKDNVTSSAGGKPELKAPGPKH